VTSHASDSPRSALVVGLNSVDYIFSINDEIGPDCDVSATDMVISPGGPAANVAVTLAGLGIKTFYAGLVGSDHHGVVARKSLVDAGVEIVETSARYSLRSPVAVVLVNSINGTRLCCGYRESGSELTIEDFEIHHLIGAVDAIYSDGYELKLTGGIIETLSLQEDLVRKPAVVIDSEDGLALGQSWIQFVDHCLPSERAALQWGNQDIPSCIRQLAEVGVDTCVVTKGKEGSVGSEGDGLLIETPSIAVDSPDTVGAGDAFRGAYLAALLCGLPFVERITFATRVAALKCHQHGTRLGSDLLSSYASELRTVPKQS